MAGIYIHIPYCRKVCYYCDFHFKASFKDVNPVLTAVNRELEYRRDYLKDEEIETIYFGGGTPSSVDITFIKEILATVYNNFSITRHPEITLEANPDDLHPAYLKSILQIGINRLSIGIQSFRKKTCCG
ncbi:MAG: radical SAM protein [Bacteroidales bacterium]|nr:radical SAM protein [Bacteroidales bacterium]